MVPPCLSTVRLLSALRLLGAAALAGVAVGLVVQTAAAAYLKLQEDCTIGQTILGDECRDAFSFFGGVHVERFVMVTLASTGIAIAVPRTIICAHGLLWAIWRRCNARIAACPAELLWRAVAVLLGRGEEARIWRQANKQRVRQARTCLHVLALGVLPVTFLASLTVLRATSPQPDRGLVLQFLFNSDGPPMILMAIIGAINDASPSFATPTKLNYINVFFSILWAWRSMVMAEDYYLYNHTWMLVIRALQGIICGNARLTILLQGYITGVELASVAINHPPGQKMYWTISRDVTMLLLISIICWTFEQTQLAAARATLRSLRSDRAAQLVHRLLSGMCEAVVKLDGQLCMAEPSPRLSSLLLRQGPLAPGLHFTDLMPAEDAKRVRVRLEAEAEEQAMAQMDEESKQERASRDQRPAQVQVLHLHLNDGSGAKLSVELFYSCLPDVDGQPSFLIGIKEDIEGQAPLEEKVEALPESTPHQAFHLAMLPEDGRTDCQSHSSWSLSEGGAARQVCLDAETPELRVLSGSSDFALLGGAAGPCSQLKEWLSTEDLSRLSAWLSVAQPDSPIPGCTVKLQPPTCKGCYQVSCTLRAVPASIAHEGSDPVCVLFENATFKPWLVRTAKNEAVDRAMSQHRQRAAGMDVEAQGGGATSSAASSSTVRSNSKREDWILLWFVVCSRRLKILRVEGGAAAPHRDTFARKQPFRDWLQRPDQFVEILKRALLDHELGVGEDLPRKLGRFILTQPGTEVDRCRFTAKVYLVAISHDERAGYPCCVGVKPLHDLPLLAASEPQPGSKIVLSL